MNRLFILIAIGPALLVVLLASRANSAPIFKCTAADGNTTYTDTPCGSDANSQQVIRAPSAPAAPSPTTAKSLTPASVAAANDHSARESSASLCSSRTFNEWIKSQGLPLPDPNARRAKLIEISNQCRRALNLSDMSTPPPIAAPKPILSGPAGEAAAARLMELVKSGSVEQLQKYLSLPGVDINDRPGTDEALLDYAADQNQVGIARYLIEHGAHVDAVQTQGRNAGLTALHRAATIDGAEVAEMLLAHGAGVNVHGPLGITPLIIAASNGGRRTTEVLLNHGADLSVTTGHRETALSEATAHGHKDIVQLLLTHVPTPSAISMNTVAARGDLEALRLMLAHDELVHDIGTTAKNEALRFAILGGVDRLEDRKRMIELLVSHGADIDNRLADPDVIPVMFATTPDLVEFMFAHGANKKAGLSGAQLAQAFACNDRNKDPIGTLQVLISHGIDIRGAPSARVSSAMSCATRSRNQALVGFLNSHGIATDEPPRLIARQNGIVTNVTIAGQLAAKHPVACVPLDQVSNGHTPPDLYLGVSACIQKEDYHTAIPLFALAGLEGRFDAERVLDKSAGQAVQVLIMSTLDGLPEDKRAKFAAGVNAMAADPDALAQTCTGIRKIGYPTYFPEYMVLHGIHAFTAKPGDPAMEPQFDSAARWNSLLRTYLNCPDQPVASSTPASALPERASCVLAMTNARIRAPVPPG